MLNTEGNDDRFIDLHTTCGVSSFYSISVIFSLRDIVAVSDIYCYQFKVINY